MQLLSLAYCSQEGSENHKGKKSSGVLKLALGRSTDTLAHSLKQGGDMLTASY